MATNGKERNRLKSPRVAARALIRDGSRLLTVRMRDPSGIFHVLPGGGQLHGETLVDAVQRECREELGCDISVGDLFYVREYIGRNHHFSVHHRQFHQIEIVFCAALKGNLDLNKATEQDRKQIGFEWLELSELEAQRFLPATLIPVLQEGSMGNRYLGDVN